MVLVARAFSVYISFGITNRLPFFNNEPNVPGNWQHIINWGGLRGVIPLVLVYSLPQTYPYYELLLNLTLATFLFTLFINALSIEYLLKKLGLHLPAREEEIAQEEQTIFDLEQAKEIIYNLPEGEVDPIIMDSIIHDLDVQEEDHKNHLLEIITPEKLASNLRLQALSIERSVIEKLYRNGHVNENVFYEYQTEVDLQQDAIKYPDIYEARGYLPGGFIKSGDSFWKKLKRFRLLVNRFPFLNKVIGASRGQLIFDRYALLRARIVANQIILEHLDNVKECMEEDTPACEKIDQVKLERQELLRHNRQQADKLIDTYPRICKSYQKDLVRSLMENPEADLAYLKT